MLILYFPKLSFLDIIFDDLRCLIVTEKQKENKSARGQILFHSAVEQLRQKKRIKKRLKNRK